MMSTFFQAWGFPAAGVLIAAGAWAYARHSAHSFDRKYGRSDR